MKNILITGITGQDGLFLSKLLLENSENKKILGLTRGSNNKIFFKNLKNLNVKNYENITLKKIDYQDKFAVDSLLQSFQPDCVYNLMGPSSVYESIINPKNKQILTSSFDTITNSLIKSRNFCRFFQASSSEMFDVSEKALNEQSKMQPRSPYAEAKFQNHLKINKLNTEFNWKIFSGIMFNHESEFRTNNYLIMKIINKAIEISNDKSKKLTIGSTEYIRDWSYAGEVANAMHLICNKGSTTDYIIGSGKGTSIKSILNIIFSHFKLHWEDHVLIDKNLLRKGDPLQIISNPNKIKKDTGWSTTIEIEDILEKCIKSRLKI